MLPASLWFLFGLCYMLHADILLDLCYLLPFGFLRGLCYMLHAGCLLDLCHLLPSGFLLGLLLDAEDEGNMFLRNVD
jgi:hypothetical protein